jgi:hypothetical protein
MKGRLLARVGDAGVYLAAKVPTLGDGTADHRAGILVVEIDGPQGQNTGRGRGQR